MVINVSKNALKGSQSTINPCAGNTLFETNMEPTITQ